MMESRLVHDNEKTYFALCLAISIISYIALIVSIIGIFYIIGGVVITFVMHGLMVGHIKNNGVRLTDRQFPEIHARAHEIAVNMGIKDLPYIYIVESGGTLNAFATRFLGRNFIILYSDMVEIAQDGYSKELDFIIAHELAHIKRNHITKNLLILPAMWTPFLGDAYSRACEYTCDRIATSYINDHAASVNALSILAIGKKLFTDLNIDEYLYNANQENDVFTWLSHVLSTHPPLPKRIAEVRHHGNMMPIYSNVKAG